MPGTYIATVPIVAVGSGTEPALYQCAHRTNLLSAELRDITNLAFYRLSIAKAKDNSIKNSGLKQGPSDFIGASLIWSGNMPLETGDVIRGEFIGATASDVCEMLLSLAEYEK